MTLMCQLLCTEMKYELFIHGASITKNFIRMEIVFVYWNLPINIGVITFLTFFPSKTLVKCFPMDQCISWVLKRMLSKCTKKATSKIQKIGENQLNKIHWLPIRKISLGYQKLIKDHISLVQRKGQTDHLRYNSNVRKTFKLLHVPLHKKGVE